MPLGYYDADGKLILVAGDAHPSSVNRVPTRGKGGRQC